MLEQLDFIDFRLQDTNADVLGDAYEYLIAQFASDAGKKAGEFYTPQQVSKILAKIVTTDKHQLKNAYDPTCGSGSLLLRVGKYAPVEDYYGQELNRTTYNLCRMNLLLHGVRYDKFDIAQDDTLLNPQHKDMKFEAIVANPPFSANWKGKENPLNESDERFSRYGVLAPTSKADFAFLQHMIYQLADNGTLASVFPHGILFRGASEGKIREYMIKELNCIDAIIGLPANLFFGTSIPACIVVVKKCRKHSDNILFIDASQEFEKEKNQNKLTDAHVDKIVQAYKDRKDIEKFSHVASLKEVAENDYNLNIPRYVDTFEEEEVVDINAVANRLKEIDAEMGEVDKELAKFCEELNIPKPF